jgi:hypothetical protein
MTEELKVTGIYNFLNIIVRAYRQKVDSEDFSNKYLSYQSSTPRALTVLSGATVKISSDDITCEGKFYRKELKCYYKTFNY